MRRGVRGGGLTSEVEHPTVYGLGFATLGGRVYGAPYTRPPNLLPHPRTVPLWGSGACSSNGVVEWMGRNSWNGSRKRDEEWADNGIGNGPGTGSSEWFWKKKMDGRVRRIGRVRSRARGLSVGRRAGG